MVEKPTRKSLEKRIQELEARIRDLEGSGPERSPLAQQQAEAALQERDAHLRAVINTIPDLIWLKDPNGVYISCNPRFERFFGAKESDIVGKNDYDFLPRDEARFFREKDRIAMAAGGPTRNEEEITYADDGHRERLETLKTPMYDKQGRLIGVLGIARDITERRQMETRLRQVWRLETIGTLAGGIAHDLKNMLVPILSFSEMLLAQSQADSPDRERLSRIHESALRARDLVSQVLTFSSRETDRPGPINLAPVIREAWSLIRTAAPPGVKIDLNLDENSGIVRANTTQIHQILLNLAFNAFYAMEEEGGTLSITLDASVPPFQKAPGAYVCLTVADTGTGMAPDIIDQIFDPFFTTKSDNRGTGMGLAVVHGIVAAMNGRVTVDSEQGQGSVFKVWLPAEQGRIKQEAPKPESPILRGTERILLVDDEAVVITAEKQILEFLGYRVTARKSGTRALELFARAPGRFDLVMADLVMPDMTGEQLFSRIRQIRPDMPVLVCSGFSHGISDTAVQALGIKGFISKPVRIQELSRTLRQILDRDHSPY